MREKMDRERKQEWTEKERGKGRPQRESLALKPRLKQRVPPAN